MVIRIALTFFLASMSVNSHDCKRYNLTPSDQLLIDMMQHYLYSSRKSGGKVPSKSTGQAGGMKHDVVGGGVNTLCLPNDPENGHAYSYPNDLLYGSEYEIASPSKTSGLPSSLFQKEVPCAVCRRRQASSVIMIPGRKTCYDGWNVEYSGFLTSNHKAAYRSEYTCIDKTAEPLDSRSSNDNEGLFCPVRAKCGSLRCPPYKDGTEVYCVVCSK